MPRDIESQIMALLYEDVAKAARALARAKVCGVHLDPELGAVQQWRAIAAQLDDAQWKWLVQVGTGQLQNEAAQSDAPELVDATWFSHGVQAIEAVCLIRVGDKCGTGFFVPVGPAGGTIVTNYHVLASAAQAANACAEFRSYDARLRVESGFKSVPLTPPDPSCFWSSSDDDLAFVALTEQDARAITEGFGAVRLQPSGHPEIDQRVVVVQHPRGASKQVAVFGSNITDIAKNETRVRYSSHTDYGSSGGLVADLNWRPVAVHHAGLVGQYNEGIHIDTVVGHFAKFFPGGA